MIDGRVVDKPVDHGSWGRLRALYQWLKPATPSHPNVFNPFDDYVRSDLKPARTSSEKTCGCSQAAKCPPVSTLL